MAPQIVKIKACIACRTRKVRCDRKSPCTNCSRWSVECAYPSPVRRCRRPSRRQPQRSYCESENKVPSLGLSIQLHQPIVSNIIVNGAKVLSLPDQPETPVNGAIATTGDWKTRPLRGQVRTCWQCFVERVDPVVKILHRPSVEMILIQSIYRPGSLNGNQKALIYAIYFSGIASMSDDEVQNLFGMTKDTSLMAYRSSTEEALAQGIFLNLNEDLIALQALVLFLSVSRLIGEAGVSWKLTGIARRSAIFNKPDLSSFEHELRKRLWCQLWYLDHRAARDLGQDDGSDMVPIPDLPLNINDSDLNPDSSTPATPCTGWTEQTFSLVRFQIAIARQRVSRDIPTETKKQIIQACQTRVEDLYLQYCTSSKDPIQWLTRHVAHVLIMEMWFELYSADTLTISVGPQKCAYKYEQRVQDFLFLQAIDIVDTAVRLEGEPQSRQWAWLLKGYQQFRPLVFLLNELHYRQECTAVSRAWMVVESALVRCQGSPNGKFLARLEERAHTIRLRITDSSSDAVQSSYIAPT